jgi:hypothetical protein
MDFATLTFQRLGLDCDPVPASDAGLELELKKALRGLKATHRRGDDRVQEPVTSGISDSLTVLTEEELV